MKNIPLPAESIPEPDSKSAYPKSFLPLVKGRVKRKLGNYFGLSNFGVNLTQLSPGSISALFHHHSKQDEFIYVISGTPTLILGNEEFLLNVGDCFGFKAGSGVASQVVNQSSELVEFIEVGDRTEGDEVEYPNDDLKATQLPDNSWTFQYKDGTQY